MQKKLQLKRQYKKDTYTYNGEKTKKYWILQNGQALWKQRRITFVKEFTIRENVVIAIFEICSGSTRINDIRSLLDPRMVNHCWRMLYGDIRKDFLSFWIFSVLECPVSVLQKPMFWAPALLLKLLFTRQATFWFSSTLACPRAVVLKPSGQEGHFPL